MRIGLESSFAAQPHSGIGAYLAGLSAALERRSDVEIVSIIPPSDSLVTRFGSRADRFSWESARAGLASRQLGIDLLHMPLMAVPIGARVPVVATVHDVIPFVIPEYRQSPAMRTNLTVAKHRLNRAEAIIAPSQHAALDIEHVLGIPADRIFVTPEAVEATYVPAAEPPAKRLLELGITGPYIFNIGGYDVRKNLPLLIEAFADLIANRSDPLTLVIGGAPHSGNPTVFPPIDGIIRDRDLTDRIILTGRISEADKVLLMQHATIYVTPSIYEGFGLTALEAMACGIPVVAANRSSLPEVVGDAGVLIEPTRQALTTAMQNLLDNPDLRSDLSAKGLARAKSFSWDRCAELTVAVYRHVLAQKGNHT